jgi:hypothetical protein
MSDVDLPVTLALDAETGDRFLLYASQGKPAVELRFVDDQPWFTQAQLAAIFGVDLRTANEHVLNFLREGELEESTIRKFRIVRQEGARRVQRVIDHYSLDVAFYVGYRVNSRQGALFRRWATEVLIQYATKGYVLDDERLKNPDGRPDYFDDLLDRIRDIRTSEKRMWTRVLELASFCSDYDPADKRQQRDFFATIQNAMHWAVTQQTAAEVIFDRVDSTKPSAGLTHYRGETPTFAEAIVAKNYYAEGEIKALNLMTSLTLEFFESQAEQRRPTLLADFLRKMRELIRLDGRPLMPAGHRGSISKRQADKKAAEQLAIFTDAWRAKREFEGERALKALVDQTQAAKRRRRTKKSRTERS